MYSGSISLYGHMDLHGNPISDFEIYMQDGATFADGSDYGKVVIGTEVTLHSNIPSDVYIMSNGIMKVASGDSYVIFGNVEYWNAWSGGIIEIAENAVLTISENLIFSSGEVVNNGTLICNGEIY